MAAPTCEACFTTVANKKSYRRVNALVFAPCFEEIGINSLETVCYQCFNKLNRINNFDNEIRTKLEQLQRAKAEIVAAVLQLPGVRTKSSTPGRSLTPVVRQKKRQIHTPTGITPKSKRGLFCSPKQRKASFSELSHSGVIKVNVATQTPIQTDEFSVKVTVKYGGEDRSKIITDSTEQAVVKGLFNNSTPSAIVKSLARKDSYKKAMITRIGQSVKAEVDIICKQRETLLKTNASPEELLTVDWAHIAESIDSKLPALMGVLRSFHTNKKKSSLALVTAVSTLLYSRSQNLNLLQFVFGIVMDSCGLTKEGLTILHNVGLCVSYSSVHKKKKRLIQIQEENVMALVNQYKTMKLYSDSTTEQSVITVDIPCETCANNSPVTVRDSLRPVSSGETSTGKREGGTSIIQCESVLDTPCQTSSNSNSPVTVRDSLPPVSSGETSTGKSEGGTSIIQCESDESIKPKSFEILGDNVDVTITPARMTLDRQRKSLHWFLLMVKSNRVSYEDLNVPSTGTQHSQPHIMDISTHEWIPSSEQTDLLKQNFIFHVSQILRKYVKELNPIKYPDFIQHDYIHLTKRKSAVLNCDLVDESENSSSGMIKILQKVHEIAVPHINKTVTEKVVFGGDVLTNERAFAAQSAMQNNMTDFDSLAGIIHRPEGLHREFNFLTVIFSRQRLVELGVLFLFYSYISWKCHLYNKEETVNDPSNDFTAVMSYLLAEAIYQLFYKQSSAVDRGSLYQLRNLVNRRNVTGSEEIKEKFRPHMLFIEDVTDAYIVSAFLDMMDMEDMASKPSGMPVLSLLSEEQKIMWLNSASERLIDCLQILDLECIDHLRQDLCALNEDDQQIEAMQVNGVYECFLCTKSYKSHAWCKKHLEKVHKWKFHQVTSESYMSNPVTSFLFMSLLFRDTCNAYKLGDGDRIVRNAYFEWLIDSALRHTKYKLWLWRMISYCISILGSKKSFEYKWNMCMNLKGGISNNIPNDNGVELQVKNIKAQLNTQGVNKTFESARKVCMTTQVIDSIKNNFVCKTKCILSKRDRPEVDKTNDIEVMVKCLRQKSTITDFRWESFKNFQNPFLCIDAENIHSWIKEQKHIAHIYL